MTAESMEVQEAGQDDGTLVIYEPSEYGDTGEWLQSDTYVALAVERGNGIDAR